MTHRPPAPPPLGIARLGGAMYLILIVFGFFAETFVRQRFVVAGDAMATAANIRAHELLWRCGVAAGPVSLMCVTVLARTWLVLLRLGSTGAICAILAAREPWRSFRPAAAAIKE